MFFKMGSLFALAAVAMLAGVGTPRLGAIRQADGVIVPFFGLASNSIPGTPLPFKDVLAASFSDKAGLVVMPDRIALLGADESEIASYASSDANAIVSVSSGLTTAVVWLPSKASVLHWNGSRFESTQLDSNLILGKVVDLVSADADDVRLLVREAAGNSELSFNGGRLNHVRHLPTIQGAALLIGSAVLFQDEGGLQLLKNNGELAVVPFSSPNVGLERASRNTVHITSGSGQRHWILQLRDTVPTVSELPRIPAAAHEVAQ